MNQIARVLLLGLACCAASSAQSQKPKVVDDGTVIEDVTLISPERQAPLAHAAVVIREGRIAVIGTNLVAGPHAKRIDGRGRFLIPGLIDSHVHVGDMTLVDDDAAAAHPELMQAYRAQLPRSYLAFGFTTLVDLNLGKDTLSWYNAAPLHPNLYHCGPAVHTANGYGAQRLKDEAAANAANVVYETAQAKNWPANLDLREYTPARAVDRVVAAGGTCVKVFDEPGFGGVFHWPVPSAETLAALRAETRRRGLALVVHANAVESWRDAIAAHADVIAHGLWHWPGDRFASVPPPEALKVIRDAARAGVAVQPTSQVIYGELSIFDRSLLDDPRFAEAVPHALIAYLKTDEAKASAQALADQYRHAFAAPHPPASMDFATAMAVFPARVTATLRLMREENVKFVFGSDTPSGDGGIGNPPGLNGRFEISRWVEAGVPLARILRAATLDNALTFGLAADFGTIEVDKRANLLLLRENPLANVSAYDSIETIFLNGEPVAREKLRSHD
jgi:imidazolonepropionase-like amidohydrolase